MLDKSDDRFKYVGDIENTLLLLTPFSRKQIRVTFVVDNIAKQLEHLLENFNSPYEVKIDFLYSYSQL